MAEYVNFMEVLAMVLPLVAYALLILGLWQGGSWRALLEAMVAAVVLLSALVAVATEGLGRFGLINATSIWVVWILLLVTLRLWSMRRLSRFVTANRVLPLLRFSRGEQMLCGGCGLILAVTLFVGLVYPPNNYDALAYHLPRIEHWIAQGSLAHYPTVVTRQLHQPPFAEFWMLHLRLLSGGDGAYHLVAWGAFVHVLIGVFLLAGRLGLSRPSQFLAVLGVATLPVAIFQGANAKNEMLLCFFLVALALSLLRLWEKPNWTNATWVGLALGLALLTKGTAFLYAGGMGVVFGGLWMWRIWRERQDWRRWVGLSAVVLSLAFVLNVSHWSRNHALYGHPLSTERDGFANGIVHPMVPWSNMVRSLAEHLVVPNETVNRKIEAVAAWHLGAWLNHPETTFWKQRFGELEWRHHEDYSGNLIGALLLLTGLPFALWSACRKKRWPLLATLAAWGLALLFYASYLRWQPWGARLELGLFVFGVPLAIAGWQAVLPRKIYFKAAMAFSFLAMVGAAPFLLYSNPRPLAIPIWRQMDREALRFVNMLESYEDYMRVGEMMRDLPDERSFGLRSMPNDSEYPLWVILREMTAADGQPRRLIHQDVQNVTASLMDPAFAPRLVISSRAHVVPDYDLLWAGQTLQVWQRPDVD